MYAFDIKESMYSKLFSLDIQEDISNIVTFDLYLTSIFIEELIKNYCIFTTYHANKKIQTNWSVFYTAVFPVYYEKKFNLVTPIQGYILSSLPHRHHLIHNI